MTPIAPGDYTYRRATFRVTGWAPETFGRVVWQITGRRGGAQASFTITAGAHWLPSGREIAAHLAAYPMYVYHDGNPRHGLLPFCAADDPRGRDGWCESLDYDPTDQASRAAWSYWKSMAIKALALLGDDLADAYEEKE